MGVAVRAVIRKKPAASSRLMHRKQIGEPKRMP
jgi:hypothetical protein